MKWLDASEIVAGMVLARNINPSFVSVDDLYPPYGGVVSIVKDGGGNTEVLSAVGVDALMACTKAAQAAGISDVDWISVLKKSAANERTANLLHRAERSLRNGEDIDAMKIMSQIESIYSMGDQFISLDGVDESEAIWIPTYYDPIDRHIGGIPDASLTIVAGPPGCLVGDTMVGINRAGKSFKITMKDLEYKFNGGRSWGRAWTPTIKTTIRSRQTDGSIKLANIKSVLYSGVKKVYKLTLANGYSVIGTIDHPVLSLDGWKELGKLNVGDGVWVDSGTQRKNGRSPKLHYKEVQGLKYHPNRRTHSKHPDVVAKHILVVEADMNEVSIEHWIDMCRDGFDRSDYLFIGRDFHVHHIDGNTKNNSISNLQLMGVKEHHRLHSHRNGRNVSYTTELSPVMDIVYVGEQDTYDIEIDGEPHNFLANGIVVHNTGKTSFLIKLMAKRALKGHKSLLFTFEMTLGQIVTRLLQIENLPDDAKANIIATEELMNIDEVYSSVARLAVQENISLIGIDFADLMSDKSEEEQSVAQIYRQCAKMAKRVGVPVILLSQLNRNYVGGIPRIHHIRWSGLAEALASMILLLYNPGQTWTDYGKDAGKVLPVIDGTGYIIGGKSRFGWKEEGMGAIQLKWDGAHAWGDESMGWHYLTNN